MSLVFLFAVGSDLQNTDNRAIAVIGDGAMTGGMAYEALNNAGAMHNKLIVILNDNDMSIAPPVGALSAYLSRLISSKSYRSLRDIGLHLSEKFPRPMKKAAKRAEEYARGMLTGGTLFEELGFYYVGPIDGHNMEHLVPVLKNVRDDQAEGPVLVHVVTQKGKGYEPAEQSADKYHGVGKFNVVTGALDKGKANAPSYTKVYAKSLITEAHQDDRIVAITAAMPSGTGIDLFEKEFPDRTFDVGLAEQHAVTFAAGLAADGMKPFATIYSTFLQRAFDQIVHDVAIQKLPVRFAIDRAGLVGADGPTHAGSFDMAYLGALPDFVLMAAADEEADEEEERDGEDDEGPLYNPLNLPLGYDGKPIPYWLYKLHGLGVEYKCEICGDMSYWGRRAFDRHFQEWRHAYGMRCLGVSCCCRRRSC